MHFSFSTTDLLKTRHLGLVLRGLLLASLGLHSVQAAAVTKCVQPDGSVTYQNMPCGISERGQEYADASKERAEAARPHAQERDLMHQLIAINSSADPIKNALSSYYQERGQFPSRKETLKAVNAGKPVHSNSVWQDLFFSVNPELPYVVSSLTYIPLSVSRNGGAQSYALVVTMKNDAPQALHGLLLGISPSPDVRVTGSNKARHRGAGINPSRPLSYYYSCHQQQAQPLDPAVTRTFANPGNQQLVCH